MRANTASNCAFISGVNNSFDEETFDEASDADAVLVLGTESLIGAGAFGYRPVFSRIAEAYFSSSVAARAPSLTAVTIWRSGLMQTSPAA